MLSTFKVSRILNAPSVLSKLTLHATHQRTLSNHIMYNGRPHPQLAQLPLTVSPFISLPTATTLPYTYKPLPSTLPPSSTADPNGVEREKYIVSASGHAAHPDEIISSCQALQAHLQKLQENAERTLRGWEAGLKDQELAEKRRLAPGWLDRDEKILEPERARKNNETLEPMNDRNQPLNIMDNQDVDRQDERMGDTASNVAGDELDRFFGRMEIQKDR